MPCRCQWPRKVYVYFNFIICFQDVLLEVMIYLTGDKTLARYQMDGALRGISGLVESRGFVKEGIVQRGPNAGQKFSEAARRAFLTDSL